MEKRCGWKMNNSEGRQLGALVFCGLSVPAIMLFPSLHPAVVVVTTVIAGWLWQTPGQKNSSALAAWGMAAVSVLCLGMVVNWAQEAYPSATHQWAMGLILLAVATYAARKGIKPLLRTAAICFFFLVVIYAVVILFGLGDISIVRKTGWRGFGAEDLNLVWLLLPLAVHWMDGGKPARPWRWAWAAICILPCLVCWLSLSANVAGNEVFPFYTLTKSISLLGVMERFEVILSAALTTGIFCLMGIFSHICGSILEKQFPRAGENVYCLVFAVSALAALVNTAWLRLLIAILAPIFWGIVPIITQLVGLGKKS